MILYAFYKDCDPVEAGVVSKRDAVVPLFVLQQFAERAPGLAGVFISCLFSGALSTLDSALHAMASVTWEEVKDFKRFKVRGYLFPMYVPFNSVHGLVKSRLWKSKSGTQLLLKSRLWSRL